ncbi:hypothetical protein [Massilia rubra]|uniref:Uncharacterized protein n=1 Tax=Massilia rubra TaxID=2607910 RepID=A0ABX0M2L1_9BURK|nr:hypothetical protein [Massilia rubra]NHZ37834.1 hypothetical protein [Massilia rubra]
MWKQAYRRWSAGLREAVACIGMGLRDARHAGLWWRASLWCPAPTLLCLWLYYHYHAFFFKLAGRAGVFALFGGLTLLDGGLGMGSGGGGGQGKGYADIMGDIARLLRDLVKFVMDLGLFLQFLLAALAMAGFFYVLLFAFANLTTVTLPLRWLLLRRAQRVAHTRYTGWQPRPLPTLPRLSAWQWTRKILKLMLSLLVPLWSLYVVLRFVLEFNVRLMYLLAAEGVLDPQQRRALMHAQGPAITMLGLILCVLMLVPLVNLLMPALLCSSVCHLQRRGWIDPTQSPPAPPLTA